MHELSIANSILEKVHAEALRLPRSRIVKVGVRVGELSGVVPEALSFSFEALVKGTDLEPLALEIEFRPRRNCCRTCSATFEVRADGPACPVCGSEETTFVSGDELDMAYLEVEEA